MEMIFITILLPFYHLLCPHLSMLILVSNMQDLKHAGVLLYANKQDIKGSMSSAEISQQLNLTSIKDHEWHIQACCALTGEG